MSRRADRLYYLLPAIYRQRDEMTGQSLQALLAVIENEFDLLEYDMAAAYDNWFIETCDAWVIPYLADLVAVEYQAIFEPPLFGQRRLVANHIAYQRRKGMAAILAHMIRDVSGWYAYVTDLSQRVARTQHMKNVTLSRGKTLDLRQGEQLALLGTAFDQTARTLDVRRVDAESKSGSLPGLVSFNSLALYLWRLKSYPIRQAQAGVPAPLPPGDLTRHFTFDPLGRDLPLFIQPEAIEQMNKPMRPGHFPQPLSRAMLAADLAENVPDSNQPDLFLESDQKASRYYGPRQEIAIWVKGRLLPAGEVLCGQIDSDHLDHWHELMAGPKDQEKKKTAVVDPQNGHFLLAEAVSPEDVTVNYTYGFSHDLGCGPFWQDVSDAAEELERRRAVRIDILRSSVDSDASNPSQPVSSLQKALDDWQKMCNEAAVRGDPPRAIIRFLDSGTYYLSGPLQPSLPSGCYLSIEAAPGERPAIILENGSQEIREEKTEVFDRYLRLQGLLISGRVALPSIFSGKLYFHVAACTLMDPLDLHLSESVLFDCKISASIIDSISVDINRGNEKRIGSLVIEDSAIKGDVKISPDPARKNVFETGISRSTVLGNVQLLNISLVEDSIVMGCLDIQDGETLSQDQVVMQYSYVFETNLFRTNCSYCEFSSQNRPLFTSTQPAHPAYVQLRGNCPVQIRKGARNGAEMGVFNSLQENRREANLMRMLPDYLPLGHRIGLFKST